MGGVFSAYLVTLGIITYRWANGPKQLPPPMAFLGATVIFTGAGLIAQADKKFGSVLAWAFVVGALAAPKSQITAVQRLTGDPITGPGVTEPYPNKDRPQGVYPNGQTGPTNAGPDQVWGTILGPGGKTPPPAKSPFTGA